MSLSARTSLLLVILMWGCSEPYDVRIQVAAELQNRATAAEVAIVPNCDSQSPVGPLNGDPFLRIDLSADMRESLGNVPAGEHGLYARLIDANCQIVAVGCQTVDVDGSGGTLHVELSAASGNACGFGEACGMGMCVAAPSDAGVDASDTGPEIDGGPEDVGPGDTGTDASDAGPSDVGPSDVGAEDAGPDAGPTFCSDHPGAILCEDFESPALRLWDARYELNGGISLTMDSYAGDTALNATRTEPEGVAYLEDSYVPAIETSTLHVRTYTYLPLTPNDASVQFMSIGEGGNGRVVSLTLRENETSVNVSTSPAPATVESLPREEWFCLEVEVFFNADNGHVRISVDGTQLMEANALDTEYAGGIGYFLVGVIRSSMDATPIQVRYDNLVVSTERIGCDM